MTELDQSNELNMLKGRANKMGISFHPSIGVAKLREKVDSKLNSMKLTGVQDPALVSANKRKDLLRKQANRLIRVNITCMDPAKKEWQGEIFTVSNSVVGTIKKYVMFNTSDGWHVPQIILNVIKERKFQQFIKHSGPRGQEIKEPKLTNAFAIEVLEPLTVAELEELAKQQAMTQSVG